jgi:hypothetical protein
MNLTNSVYVGKMDDLCMNVLIYFLKNGAANCPAFLFRWSPADTFFWAIRNPFPKCR